MLDGTGMDTPVQGVANYGPRANSTRPSDFIQPMGQECIYTFKWLGKTKEKKIIIVACENDLKFQFP